MPLELFALLFQCYGEPESKAEILMIKDYLCLDSG